MEFIDILTLLKQGTRKTKKHYVRKSDLLKASFTLSFCFMSLLILVGLIGCIEERSKKEDDQGNVKIICTEEDCRGAYFGPEFVNGDDVAHQFSNIMSQRVGDKLKKLYGCGNYSKVDFERIEMSTSGMGTGMVEFSLMIPFVEVSNRCDAYTSFDHVGGWNHRPEIEARKSQLKSALLPKEELDISELRLTAEGLQEYWIQWKNKDVQKNCVY